MEYFVLKEMYIDIDLYHSFRVVEEWDHDVIIILCTQCLRIKWG
jgi:hypothetical protein